MGILQFHSTALRLSGGPDIFDIGKQCAGRAAYYAMFTATGSWRIMRRKKNWRPGIYRGPQYVYEMAKTGADNVFNRCYSSPHNLVTTRFPNIYQFCLGLRTGYYQGNGAGGAGGPLFYGRRQGQHLGRNNIPGLFAAGENSLHRRSRREPLAPIPCWKCWSSASEFMKGPKDGRQPEGR